MITDLGVLEPDPETRELVLTQLHPGVTVDDARAATGWELAVASTLDHDAPPTTEELATLRDLRGSRSPGRGADERDGECGLAIGRRISCSRCSVGWR